MCVCILTYILCLYKLYIFTYILYIYIYSFTSFKLLLRFQRPYQIQVLFFFFFAWKPHWWCFVPPITCHQEVPTVPLSLLLWYYGIVVLQRIHTSMFGPTPIDFPSAFHLKVVSAAGLLNGSIVFTWVSKMMMLCSSFCFYQLQFFYKEELSLSYILLLCCTFL